MPNDLLKKAATLAVVLALFVVMLGAYTRLTDAGLGCPDWPGCYGHMVLPNETKALQQAQTAYPQIPIESTKAWTEMAHRYAAGSLGLLIFFIGFRVVSSNLASVGKHRISTSSQLPLIRPSGTFSPCLGRRIQGLPWKIPVLLLGLVLFQAALGMWTVTLKLLPIVVMGHLLGGILIFASLCRFRVQLSTLPVQDLAQWRPWLRLGVLIIFLQIALGGWVSANYSGISCIGFPQCNGSWLPELDLSKAFNLFSSIGENYQGGLLDPDVRVTIQWVHRLGAFITALYVLTLGLLLLMKSKLSSLRFAGAGLISLVLIQFTLGILNVVYLLPIQVAVAHNGVAAILLAVALSALHLMYQGE